MNTADPLPLLDDEVAALHGFVKLGRFANPFDERSAYEIYGSGVFVVCVGISYGKNLILKDQVVLPRPAIPWIVDCIENGFWRKPSDGGLPKARHSCIEEFADEVIQMRRSMNAGVEGEMGFSLINQTRRGYILPTSNQLIALPDRMLQDTLLPLFKSISAANT
jgi:hypothetical protein